jgi:hypothetical protein
MLYINQTTLEYPLTQAMIASRFPNTSFGIPFSPPPPYVLVTDKPKPTYDPITQGIKELTPKKEGDTWVRVWQVYSLTSKEIEANKSNKKRTFISQASALVDGRLNAFAMTRGYNNIVSACSYATSSNVKFRAEAQYCVDMRDETWSKFFEIVAEIESGDREVPDSYHDIEDELPELAWPTAP